ncbi:MAG TPA: PQQ-binding-like beta-propeller repeat protein [Pirellulales bacterium]|jgi:outer membrane protein assembly factor BamB|nr:PQQ-binding-like beta-propeller repeat protein [Pirellulales bacterium]
MRVWSLLLGVALWTLAILPASAENWPEFRGPTGQGIYAGKNLPLEWSTTENVAWKQTIPGKGWSSPIVWNGRIYLTSAVPVAGTKDLSLRAFCLNAADGKPIWDTEVFVEEGAKAPSIHGKNSHASPTPLTDGQRIYVHFGEEGTAALDLNGTVLWRNQEHRYAPVHGNGGSPILVGKLLIFAADGSDTQAVIALNQADGKTVWQTDRQSVAAKKFSFGTPLAIEVAGQTQVVSPASDAVMAYDPTSGKELWRVKYDGYSLIPRPVFGDGLVFLSTGYNTPSAMAIRTDGHGDVTATHVAWTVKKGAPHTPSMLLVGDALYMVSDAGIASCLDAKSGQEHWRERVPGNYSASPFAAEGRIYFHNEDGLTTVVRAAPKFEVLASNDLKERMLASAAIADGAIYLRTESQLYRLQRK